MRIPFSRFPVFLFARFPVFPFSRLHVCPFFPFPRFLVFSVLPFSRSSVFPCFQFPRFSVFFVFPFPCFPVYPNSFSRLSQFTVFTVKCCGPRQSEILMFSQNLRRKDFVKYGVVVAGAKIELRLSSFWKTAIVDILVLLLLRQSCKLSSNHICTLK